MLDSNFNTYLLEVNASPAMDYSTDITKRLVKTVLPDTMKVVLDYNYAKKYEKENIDTGMFTLIYKGEVNLLFYRC